MTWSNNGKWNQAQVCSRSIKTTPSYSLSSIIFLVDFSWPLKYLRNNISPYRTAPSQILWLQRAQTTLGCFLSKKLSTAPCLCPPPPLFVRRRQTLPLWLRIGRGWSREVQVRRAAGRRGGREWRLAQQLRPPPPPWPSARGPSWRGWRGEPERGAGKIFLGRIDPWRRRWCCLPGELLRRAKSWWVNLILSFLNFGQKWHCTLGFYFYVIRLRMCLFLLCRQLFWKSRRVLAQSGNIISRAIPWQQIKILVSSCYCGNIRNGNMFRCISTQNISFPEEEFSTSEKCIPLTISFL